MYAMAGASFKPKTGANIVNKMQISKYEREKPNDKNKINIGNVITIIVFRRPIVSESFAPKMLPIGYPINVRLAN